VDLEALKSAGLVRKAEGGVKVLGKGDLDRPLTVKVDQVSKTAKEKSNPQAERWSFSSVFKPELFPCCGALESEPQNNE